MITLIKGINQRNCKGATILYVLSAGLPILPPLKRNTQLNLCLWCCFLRIKSINMLLPSKVIHFDGQRHYRASATLKLHLCNARVQPRPTETSVSRERPVGRWRENDASTRVETGCQRSRLEWLGFYLDSLETKATAYDWVNLKMCTSVPLSEAPRVYRARLRRVGRLSCSCCRVGYSCPKPSVSSIANMSFSFSCS